MKTTRTMRCITAWIASFAILLAALAPSISHAVAAAKNMPNGWTEICTVAGAKLVKLDDAPSKPAPTHKMSHFEHCPFCLSHAVSLGMPPDATIAIPSLEGTHILPPLFYHAPRPLFAWSTAQPRAPPFLA
ncbi:MAG TPA: DUF2946 domain-containing protein [Oxalicibacterium sp.]|nr:DUF2946 domain-containing protein [Oxalicibacterium sp.]